MKLLCCSGLGIIPADAGSTWGGCANWPWTGDHPRGCGEHVWGSRHKTIATGSSPRMRGALCSKDAVDGLDGIIPADAGSTTAWAKWSCPGQDHPRGCGEHGICGCAAKFGGGSSPRMRGARPQGPTPTACRRIIPADAGSTADSTVPEPAEGDHPRGCGEHFTSPCVCNSWSGSSPRMRGARYEPAEGERHEGIIPADAGSTSWRPACRGSTLDHPRGCGEHTGTTWPSQPDAGSSPRMRGAPTPCIPLPVDGGIIPADAGSTLRPAWLRSPAGDHPRGCGEHEDHRSAAHTGLGSSPRMRGAPGGISMRMIR